MPTPSISIYPKLLLLRDREEVAIRPMTPTDEGALLDFFLRLSEEDRFYLKDDVTAPGVIAGWVRDLDYERVLPLLAWQHDRIVGDATLHRRRGGARRHMGEVRVTVDPALRGRGLGTALLHELIDYASQVELETLVFELIGRVPVRCGSFRWTCLELGASRESTSRGRSHRGSKAGFSPLRLSAGALDPRCRTRILLASRLYGVRLWPRRDAEQQHFTQRPDVIRQASGHRGRPRPPSLGRTAPMGRLAVWQALA
jgi:GNAT superfamily N-acetyltransferase